MILKAVEDLTDRELLEEIKKARNVEFPKLYHKNWLQHLKSELQKRRDARHGTYE